MNPNHDSSERQPQGPQSRGWLVYFTLSLLLAGSMWGIVTYSSRLSSATDINNKRINLAGRQRALSQRMTKALLAYDSDSRSGKLATASLGELNKVANLFDVVLRGFESGGVVPGTDGKDFDMPKSTDDDEQIIIRDALEIWLPLKTRLAAVMAGTPTAEELARAVDECRAQNVPLFDQMNLLTNRTEQTARAQIAAASGPRNAFIVVASISLFGLPGFALWSRARSAHLRSVASLGELQVSHGKISSQARELEAAKAETDRIMGTVQEGLMLIDERGVIGDFYSRELTKILRQDDLAGLNLLSILQRLLSEKMYNTTKDYLTLLFDGGQREKAVLRINPLVDIEINFPNPDGGFSCRYLGFSFRRILDPQDKSKVNRVFVAVRDITAQMELEKQLRESEKNKERQLEILLGIVHVRPEELDAFTDMVATELEQVNQVLRAEDFAGVTGRSSEAMRDNLNAVFRSVHNIKGNAAYLKMEYFQKAAEAFESKIQELRSRPVLNGDDFLAVVVLQAGLRADLADVLELRGKLAGFRGAKANAVETEGGSTATESALVRHLTELVATAANAEDKQVAMEVDAYSLHAFSQSRGDLVRDVLIQLARNSVAHSIETPTERAVAGKPELATISLRGVPRTADGLIGVAFRDDGGGLNLEKIRMRAVEMGLIEEFAQIGETEIAGLIFHPGFSTRLVADANAGRGAGMDIIKAKIVDELGGAIEVKSMPGKFCEFTLYLPESVQSNSANTLQ